MTHAPATPDMINHPPHYIAASGLEVLEVIHRYRLDYWLGNVVKYLIRAGRKGDAALDLKKARYYAKDWLERYIAYEIVDPTADEDTLEWKTPEQIADEFGLTGDRREAVIDVLDMAVFAFDFGPSGQICSAIARIDADIAALAEAQLASRATAEAV